MEEAELEAQKHQKCIKPIENASSNPFHRTALENFRKERKIALKNAKNRANNLEIDEEIDATSFVSDVPILKFSKKQIDKKTGIILEYLIYI